MEGKILRLNDDGTIPDDNPFSDSPVFSYGHRDPKGMAWDKDGNLFMTEIGPSKNDEINLIHAGKNYGWPEHECIGSGKFIAALNCYDPGIEPGGIIFYYGDKLDIKKSHLMATLMGSHLFSIEIDENGSWKPLDLNKTYGMVSNNFIRGGGDGYKVFRSASEIYDFGPDLADVVANYIKANPGYSGYTDNRITQE